MTTTIKAASVSTISQIPERPGPKKSSKRDSAPPPNKVITRSRKSGGPTEATSPDEYSTGFGGEKAYQAGFVSEVLFFALVYPHLLIDYGWGYCIMTQDKRVDI